MRTRTFIAMLAVLSALATGTVASADPSGVVSSGSGGYGFSGEAAGSFFVVYPFTWNVELHADGRVHGDYSYTQIRDGVELTVSGSLSCAVFLDDRVWVGGVIEDSSRASLIGLDMWFQAKDNGEGATDSADMSSTIGAGGPGTAQQYCDDAPEVRFPFLLEQGNLQVRSG
jgi:hypothetical protein